MGVICWYKEKTEQSDLEKLACTAKDFTPKPNQFSKENFFQEGGHFCDHPDKCSEIDWCVNIIRKIFEEF